jgi:hypothetical protein
MHGLTGAQEPRNWRTDDLLHVGEDLRRQREAGARPGNHAPSGEPRHGLRGWVGRHLVGVGQAVAGETPGRPPCPDLPQMGSKA